MAITYHAGRRIQGLATDRTAVTPTIDTTSSAGNTIITFTGDGTFAPKSVFDVEYLVVGGGGSGAVNSGGGGAGGYRTATGFEVTVQNYTINVGEGGIGSGYTGDRGNNGSDSVFSTITSTGGGGGGCELSGQIIGGNGGSGGGGGHTSGSAGGISSPVTSPVQGYAGGSSGNTQVGGGGGGSSVVGSNGSGATAGNGGNGTANSITGSSVTYSAGGGGGDVSSGSTGGSSGIGGDGSGQNGTGTAGDTNTGSGGGGSTGGSGNSGNGGSGIVIIKFVTSGNTYSVNGLDDVQVGSRFEETDTRKIYHYESGLKYEDDFSDDNWTDNDSTYIGVSGGSMNWNAKRDGSNDASVYDLTSTSANWVLRFKLTVTNVSSSTQAGNGFYVGLSDSIQTAGQSTSQDFIGVSIYNDNTDTYRTIDADGSALPAVYSGDSSQVTTYSTGSVWYYEIIKTGSSYTVEAFSGSDYSTGSEGKITGSSPASGLRYLKVLNDMASIPTSTNPFQGTINALKFYNGVTSSTGNAWKEEGT